MRLLMDHSNLVSIVLPTYNGSRHLRQSIDSCLAQTHQDIELIVVDDASTDDTPNIVASYADKRIKYIRHERNKQLPTALNTGFSQACGAYLTWTSDDNLYSKNAIERMVQFLRHEKCGFVYCDYYEFKDDDLDHLELIRLPEKAAFDRANCVRACFLYLREVQDAVGQYDPETLLCEDYDYWIRVWRKFRLGHLAEPLYFYRRHGAALYSRRYWEVEVIKFLVRLKHDIVDVSEVGDVLIRQMAGRRRFVPGPHRLNKLIAHALPGRKIRNRLADFKAGRISFGRLRSDVNALVNGAPAEG